MDDLTYMWDLLAPDVLLELKDPRFASRTHGTRGTYARGERLASGSYGKGCRGPLCRKAERDGAELKYSQRRARDGKRARSGLKDDDVRARDEELDIIIEWHKRIKTLERMNKLVLPDQEPEELETAV